MPELYTGDETAIELEPLPVVEDPDVAFGVLRPDFKEPVKPIFDPDIGMIIGYRTYGTVWKVYDIQGNYVTMEELPLEIRC